MVFKRSQSNAQICAWTLMGFHGLPWTSIVYMLWLFVLHFTPLCWDLLDWNNLVQRLPPFLALVDEFWSKSFVHLFIRSFNQSTNQLLNDAGQDDIFWFARNMLLIFTVWMLWFSCLFHRQLWSLLRCLLASAGVSCGCGKVSPRVKRWPHNTDEMGACTLGCFGMFWDVVTSEVERYLWWVGRPFWLQVSCSHQELCQASGAETVLPGAKASRNTRKPQGTACSDASPIAKIWEFPATDGFWDPDFWKRLSLLWFCPESGRFWV